MCNREKRVQMYLFTSQVVKNLPASAGALRDAGSIPRWGRSLEEGMATHSSILAWRIPWTEEPSGLQSTGSQRAGHDWSNLACMNLCTKQEESRGCRKQTYGSHGVGGVNWEIVVGIYILLYIKSATNKNLLYGTGKSTQYSVMACIGKDCKRKERIYVYG